MNDKPTVSGVAVGDSVAALNSVIGILCALRARDKTGEGQYVDISFTDSSLYLGVLNLAHYMAFGLTPRAKDVRLMQNVWETKDGKYIVTAPVESYFYERFCRALGLDELISLQYSQGKKNEEVVSAIAEKMKTKTRDEWFEILKEANTCVSPVLSFKEVINNPQMIHRQMFIELDHPVQKKVKQLGFAVKLSKTPAQFRSFAPKLGQNTDDLMKQMGYKKEQIDALRSSKAIK
jgi:crotonobetainyl-CoA:carnitine CoA-transferase CaiB-like acyl-CoA transferase